MSYFRSVPVAREQLGIGCVVLQEGTASAQATLDLSWSGTYRSVIIELSALVPVTDATDLYLRTSADSGATFASGASDYAWHNTLAFTTLVGAAGDAADAQIVINRNDAASQHISNVAAEGGIAATITIHDPASSAIYPRMGWQYQVFTDGTGFGSGVGGGARLAAVSINAVRLLFSSGNIASGSYAVYGMR